MNDAPQKWATVYVYDSREAVDPVVAEAADYMLPWPPSGPPSLALARHLAQRGIDAAVAEKKLARLAALCDEGQRVADQRGRVTPYWVREVRAVLGGGPA